MTRYRVTIQGKDYDAVADLVRMYEIDIISHTARELPKGYSVDAVVTSEHIHVLEEHGYTVKILEDVDEIGRIRQAEVGVGDRYKGIGPNTPEDTF
jgi:carboxypeptidase T